MVLHFKQLQIMRIRFFMQTLFFILLFTSCKKDDDTISLGINQKPITIFFAVQDLNGDHIDKAEVKIYNAKRYWIGNATSTTTGLYTVDLPPGSYYVNVYYGGLFKQITFELTTQSEQINVTLDSNTTSTLGQSSAIIITGIASDPRGSDSASEGTTNSYNDGTTIITHGGGYEYVQFMAMRDLDFSQEPHAVVFANNGKVGPKGWAEGGKKTYKINLTSGKVKKGTFFYVGGKSKVISGYGPCGLSTSISQLNWIATKDYAVEAGDQFGDPTKSLLGNMSSSGVNTADGIAVFEGIEIDKNTIPIDAVFYGTTIGDAYNETENFGYRIPTTSDLYTTIKEDTGEQQPYFGQGTNTHLLVQPNTDVGEFILLGGNTTDSQWITPRKSSLTTLSYCPGESDSYSIENGPGITLFEGQSPSIPPEVDLPETAFSVMSFNIRNDNTTDLQSLMLRKELILNVIQENTPHIVGLQEFSNGWFINWMQTRMEALGYAYYIERDKGTASPKAIFYKSNRFALKNAQTFLMEFTELRSGTWVILEDRKTNSSIFISNSHWTTTNSTDRLENAKIVLEQLSQHATGLPSIILGDFNAKPGSKEIKLIENFNLPALTTSHSGDAMTLHAWKGVGKSKIDWIFHSNDFTVHHAQVIRTAYNNYWPSDHWPIIATYSLR